MDRIKRWPYKQGDCEAGFHRKIAKLYVNLIQTPSGRDFHVQAL